MNWWKLSQKKVVFLSYNSYGELALMIGDRRYTYLDISPFLKDRIIKLIRRSAFGPLFKTLKSLRTVEQEKRDFNDPQMGLFD